MVQGEREIVLRVVRRQDACSTARNRGKALCTDKRTIRQDELERIRRSAVKRRGRAVSLLDKWSRRGLNLHLSHHASKFHNIRSANLTGHTQFSMLVKGEFTK